MAVIVEQKIQSGFPSRRSNLIQPWLCLNYLSRIEQFVIYISFASIHYPVASFMINQDSCTLFILSTADK